MRFPKNNTPFYTEAFCFLIKLSNVQTNEKQREFDECERNGVRVRGKKNVLSSLSHILPFLIKKERKTAVKRLRWPTQITANAPVAINK